MGLEKFKLQPIIDLLAQDVVERGKLFYNGSRLVAVRIN